MAVKKTNGFPEGKNLPDELLKLLQSLASNWGDAFDLKTLEVVRLTGAMTNEIYRISWPTMDQIEGAARIVLVRMYGQGVEHFFERDDEIRTFECVSAYGHGPKLLGRFEEGRVEEFIHARTLSAEDLRHPETSALIAAKLRQFHNLDMPGRKNVVLWNRLRKWLNVAKNLCPHEHAKQYKLDSLDREIGLLEKAISRRGQEIGFCHNDLQYGNIMINDKSKTITIIDYEYASYNPVAYDIANHFCEMAADYHTDTPHILDYSKYPDWEERQRFMKQYLTSEGLQTARKADDRVRVCVRSYYPVLDRYHSGHGCYWSNSVRVLSSRVWTVKVSSITGFSPYRFRVSTSILVSGPLTFRLSIGPGYFGRVLEYLGSLKALITKTS